MQNKKFVLVIAFILLLNNIAVSQYRCSDTIRNTSLYNAGFRYSPGTSIPFLDIDSGLIYSTSKYLIKKNKNNTLSWGKKIEKFSTSFLQNDKGIIGGFYYQHPITSNIERGVAKIDSSGNFLWAKKLITTNSYTYNFGPSKGNNDEVVLINRTLNFGFSIVILNSNGTNVKLNKLYENLYPISQNMYDNAQSFTIDNNFIYIAYTNAITQNSPTRHTDYLTLIKINYNTGDIVKTAKYNFNDVFTVTTYYNPLPIQGYSFTGRINSLSMKKAGDYIYLAANKTTSYSDCNRRSSIKIDSNLNIVTNKMYKFPPNIKFWNTYNQIRVSIDDNGNSLFADISNSQNSYFDFSDSCYYFFTDNELKITAQRLQHIAQSGLSSSNGFERGVVPFLQNNGKASLIYHTTTSQNDSVLHIVNISQDIKPSSCIGQDDNSITTETLTYNTLPPPTFIVTNAPPITITPYSLSSTDIPVQETKFCEQISICDSLKIIGNTNFCITAPNATFKFYKNPQCLRKVSWVIDTTVIQILSTPNDSTINVKFLQPFHGYIKAAVDGCVVKDSLYIDVSTPKQALNLGADTTHCPGKTILLNAGLGFKNYEWQNNSPNSTFTATQPSTYFVKATDSCNNIFRDTIVVKPMDVNFNMLVANPICLYDTAIVSLNTKMNNYLWSPSGSAFKENNTIKFFPDNTTLYTITADRFVGCTLTDTVNVKVIKCPIYFYVPTAFTPNSDNLNDLFKPIVSGKIESYQFSVFNRFGQKVFSSKKVNEGWNGKLNGVIQDIGAYTWVCSYKFKNQEASLKKGSVLIIK